MIKRKPNPRGLPYTDADEAVRLLARRALGGLDARARVLREVVCGGSAPEGNPTKTLKEAGR
jgi:hypothetical protein